MPVAFLVVTGLDRGYERVETTWLGSRLHLGYTVALPKRQSFPSSNMLWTPIRSIHIFILPYWHKHQRAQLIAPRLRRCVNRPFPWLCRQQCSTMGLPETGDYAGGVSHVPRIMLRPLWWLLLVKLMLVTFACKCKTRSSRTTQSKRVIKPETPSRSRGGLGYRLPSFLRSYEAHPVGDGTIMTSGGAAASAAHSTWLILARSSQSANNACS